MSSGFKIKLVNCKPMPPGRGGWTDWVTPIMTGYHMQCCGCGLKHEMQFRVLEQTSAVTEDGTWSARPVKSGRVEFRAKRKI